MTSAHSPGVTDLLIQRGPSADSVTRPVETLSQRVSSRLPSLPLFCQAYASMQLLYFQNKRDSHPGDSKRTRKRFLLMQETRHK